MSRIFRGRKAYVMHLANAAGGVSCRAMTMEPTVTKDVGEVTCKGCLRTLRERPNPNIVNRRRRLAGKRAAANPYVQRKFGNLNLQPKEF